MLVGLFVVVADFEEDFVLGGVLGNESPVVLIEIVEIELEGDPLVEGWFLRGGVVGSEGELAVADCEGVFFDACEGDGELVGGVVGACGFVGWAGAHDDGLEVLVFGVACPVGNFVVSCDDCWKGWGEG